MVRDSVNQIPGGYQPNVANMSSVGAIEQYFVRSHELDRLAFKELEEQFEEW
jgi:hypothetical protein